MLIGNWRRSFNWIGFFSYFGGYDTKYLVIPPMDTAITHNIAPEKIPLYSSTSLPPNAYIKANKIADPMIMWKKN
ncbi:MAG: hypothetical protein WKF87_13845 [Chryseolinea sp.]